MDSNDHIKYFVDRSDWRQWLKKFHKKKTEVWLLYPKKVTGKSRISYNDAVEEALCFGWIDSINKRYDEDHTMQRFTPRRKNIGYSQPNIERLRWLVKEGMIHPDLKVEVQSIIEQEYVFPEYILQAIRSESDVWENYLKLSLPYRRIRIAFIEAARKRPEEFEKRLRNFIAKTKEGKLIRGYGGIEKYYE